MWLMLQQESPQDYVLATGVTKSIRDIVESAFAAVDLCIKWEGEGLNEVGKIDQRVVVRVSPKYFRPAEVDLLLGDATKAKIELGWQPTVSFDDIMNELVQHDTDNASSP
jgi:GDPmannose 4,6-dehydratase